MAGPTQSPPIVFQASLFNFPISFHIFTSIILSEETRHAALLELRLLWQDIATMPDCNALSARLKQVWLRLFTTKTEEPIRRHEASVFVHVLLLFVKDLGFKLRNTIPHKAYAMHGMSLILGALTCSWPTLWPHHFDLDVCV
jgi:hypothetical protein